MCYLQIGKCVWLMQWSDTEVCHHALGCTRPNTASQVTRAIVLLCSALEQPHLQHWAQVQALQHKNIKPSRGGLKRWRVCRARCVRCKVWILGDSMWSDSRSWTRWSVWVASNSGYSMMVWGRLGHGDHKMTSIWFDKVRQVVVSPHPWSWRYLGYAQMWH